MTARAAVAASSHNGPPPPGHYEGSASRPSFIQPSGSSSGAMLHRPQDSVSSRIAYASPRASSSAPHHPLGAPSHPPPYPSHAGHPTTQPPLSARTPAASHAAGQPMLSARTPPVGLGEASPRPGSAKVLAPPKPASQPASANGPTSATPHGGSAAGSVGGAVAAAGLPAECTGCFSPLLTPAAVLKAHAHHLTAYEQAEVLDHPQVRRFGARDRVCAARPVGRVVRTGWHWPAAGWHWPAAGWHWPAPRGPSVVWSARGGTAAQVYCVGHKAHKARAAATAANNHGFDDERGNADAAGALWDNGMPCPPLARACVHVAESRESGALAH